MQHDLVRMSGGHSRVAFRPVVRNGISKGVAGSVESGRSDGAGRWAKSCLSRQRKIPEMSERGEITCVSLCQKLPGAIRTLLQVSTEESTPTELHTASGKCSVNWMERDFVDCEGH